MKQRKQITLLVFALIVSVIILPIGIVWNIGKPIFHVNKGGIKKILHNWIGYWLILIYQIYVVIGYLAYHLALSLDLLWNTIAGEFVEDCITAEEDTLFGKGDATISESTGQLVGDGKLIKFGKKFTKFLDFIFAEKDHALNAYRRRLYRINETKK